MSPKLDWLEGFAEFAEDLNFTRAAARLHMSQPALHTQVRKLAEALEVSLYERRGRRLVLTDAGIEALRFAREMRSRTQDFIASVRGHAPTSPLILAAGEGSFLYLLGPAIRSFVRSAVAPLRLLTRAAEPAIEAVRVGDAQLAVAVAAEVPDQLQGQPLAEFQHVAVVPKTHRLATRTKISLASLAGEALVVPAQGSRLRQTLATGFSASGHELSVAVEASGWEPMLHFASLGLGPAVVNGCCRVPRGMVGVPVSDLPRVRYLLLHAPGALGDSRVAALHATVLRKTGNTRGSSGKRG
ncbi:MAG: LysR family transcriptional regulator [Nannocystales bacterium]